MCLQTASVVSFKSPEDAAIQFTSTIIFQNIHDGVQECRAAGVKLFFFIQHIVRKVRKRGMLKYLATMCVCVCLSKSTDQQLHPPSVQLFSNSVHKPFWVSVIILCNTIFWQIFNYQRNSLYSQHPQRELIRSKTLTWGELFLYLTLITEHNLPIILRL